MALKSLIAGLVFCAVSVLLLHTASAQEEQICKNGVLFVPHATNCTLYWACVGTTAVLKECPSGLWWNPNYNVCDWPADSGCTAHLSTTTNIPTEGPSTTNIPTEGPTTSNIPTEGSSTTNIPTEGPTTPDISTEGPSSTTTLEPTTTEAPTVPPHDPDCPIVDDPDNLVRYMHESRCDQYYLCVEGWKVLHACPGDFHYAYNQEYCFPPEEAGCDRCPSVDIGYAVRLPYDPVCQNYYLCVDVSTPELHTCAVAGYDFSRTKRYCYPPEEAQCTPTDVLFGRV